MVLILGLIAVTVILKAYKQIMKQEYKFTFSAEVEQPMVSHFLEAAFHWFSSSIFVFINLILLLVTKIANLFCFNYSSMPTE